MTENQFCSIATAIALSLASTHSHSHTHIRTNMSAAGRFYFVHTAYTQRLVVLVDRTWQYSFACSASNVSHALNQKFQCQIRSCRKKKRQKKEKQIVWFAFVVIFIRWFVASGFFVCVFIVFGDFHLQISSRTSSLLQRFFCCGNVSWSQL